jgi:hypothetical protein
MKCRCPLGFVVLALCVALSIPARLTAQQNNQHRHHYELIELKQPSKVIPSRSNRLHRTSPRFKRADHC